MEKATIKRSDVHLKKIFFGEEGGEDYIVISADSPLLFNRFAAGFKAIMDLAEEVASNVENLEKQYPDTEEPEVSASLAIGISQENVRFSRESVEIIDGIFGADTLKKYYSDIYAEVPDFLPDVDCVLDFLDNIVPVMEETFSKKLESQERARIERMKKYEPQDYKKPSSVK